MFYHFWFSIFLTLDEALIEELCLVVISGNANVGYLTTGSATVTGSLSLETSTVSKLLSPSGWNLVPLAFGLVTSSVTGYNLISATINGGSVTTIIISTPGSIPGNTTLFPIVSLYGLDGTFPGSVVYVYGYTVGTDTSTILTVSKNSGGGDVTYPMTIVVYGKIG